MSQNKETNPHFTWTLDSQPHGQQPQPPAPAEPQSQGRTWRPYRSSRRQREQKPDQNSQLEFPLDADRGTLPSSPQSLPPGQTPQLRRPPQRKDERELDRNQDSNFPVHDGLGTQQTSRPKSQQKTSKSSQPKVLWGQSPPPEDQQQPPQGAPATVPAQLSPPPQRRPRHDHEQDHQREYVRAHAPRKTYFMTWCFAAFCAIFIVIVIFGGLIVLIVYLVFRPHIPRFDIPSATLNTAYLDMGYYLNADLTMLVNFSNPNRKVSVDFSSVILELYYGGRPIATQYIPPFSAPKATNMFAHIEFISSQVRLPLEDSQRLQQQLASNQEVMFDVKGVFRARSNLGTFLRYSYWLYAHCTIAMSGPPSGVIRASKCRTKR